MLFSSDEKECYITMIEKRPSKYDEKDEFSDIVLVVQDKKLHVNKTLLMIHSSVFKSMFTSEIIEKDLETIPVPGKKVDLMVELLDQFYPRYTTDQFHLETLRELLQLADEFGVQQVFHNCQAYFERRIYCKKQGLKIDEILLFLGIVEEWSSKHDELSSFRFDLITKASKVGICRLKENKYFSSLPAIAQRDILMRRLEAAERKL